mmetsp:Transcript_52624/g.125711  ORF Transcript_52624/g.125711 Transcript_52624/m.125711 type:complete len:854 (+) Transcript_52624:172-2733(+)
MDALEEWQRATSGGSLKNTSPTVGQSPFTSEADVDNRTVRITRIMRALAAEQNRLLGEMQQLKEENDALKNSGLRVLCCDKAALLKKLEAEQGHPASRASVQFSVQSSNMSPSPSIEKVQDTAPAVSGLNGAIGGGEKRISSRKSEHITRDTGRFAGTSSFKPVLMRGESEPLEVYKASKRDSEVVFQESLSKDRESLETADASNSPRSPEQQQIDFSAIMPSGGMPGQLADDRFSFDEGNIRSHSRHNSDASRRMGTRSDAAAQFAPRTSWAAARNNMLGHGSSGTFSAGFAHSASAKNALHFQESDHLLESQYDGCLGRFISPPGSPARASWELLGGVLILYDLIYIPLGLFEPPLSWFTDTMDWFILMYWTLNIFASFFQGYIDQGLTIMVPQKIAKHYLRTWFLVDLTIVVPDWIFTLHGLGVENSSHEAGKSVKALRVVRLSRTVRLIRLLKLGSTLQAINDRLTSESASIIANMIQMITALLGISHYIACLWYLVALMREHDNVETWVKAGDYANQRWEYIYMSALHWSITQFTPAGMEVQPENMLERSFAVAVVVLAMLGFSYIVGSITGGMTQLRSMKEDQAKQFWSLRRYLRRNNVHLQLSIRIHRHLEHVWKRQKEGTSEASVKLLQFLSSQLREELRCAIEVPHIKVHPLIERMTESDKVHQITVQRLANNAIERKALAQNDSLFFPLEFATHMYFVASGRLQYIQAMDNGMGLSPQWIDVSKRSKDWLSEQVLWLNSWMHKGQPIAATECELLSIAPVAFESAIRQSPSAMVTVSNYCLHYVDWLNHQPRDSLSDLTRGDAVEHTLRGFLESEAETDMRRSMFRKKGHIANLPTHLPHFLT